MISLRACLVVLLFLVPAGMYAWMGWFGAVEFALTMGSLSIWRDVGRQTGGRPHFTIRWHSRRQG